MDIFYIGTRHVDVKRVKEKNPKSFYDDKFLDDLITKVDKCILENERLLEACINLDNRL